MVFPSDYPDELFREKPKGMKIILQEHNLWGSELKFSVYYLLVT
ncbi:15459_t:CDS:2 [Funneliformis geosporum]|uniref:15459_t:CDS:1 n=1 Tax=Funneliformis geosporum TaxID=1117311 RepID=A0A9W4SD83_9GLOM|nr:15459_t:CDS:2 [Funneliformis geosporum]